MTRMEDVENRLGEIEDADAGGDNWADSTVGAQFGPGPRRACRERPLETLLINGPMGQLTKPEANLFDDKLANQHGFSFDGQK